MMILAWFRAIWVVFCLLATVALVMPVSGKNKDATESSPVHESVSFETRLFWSNVQPLEDKRDLNAFRDAVQDMQRHLGVEAEIINVKQPTVVPFENLTARQAELVAEGNVIYTGTSATLRVTPAYMRFYCDVIFPKICAFFEPLAVSVSRDNSPWRIGGGSYQRYGDGGIYSNDTRYFQFPNVRSIVNKPGYCNVEISRVKNPSALYQANVGDSVAAEVVVFHLPEAYSPFFKGFHTTSVCYPVYQHVQDANNRHIWSTRKFEFYCNSLWYEEKWLYELPFADFYLDEQEAARYQNCIVNFKSDVETFPYLPQERAEKERVEREKRKEEEGFSFWILLLWFFVIAWICMAVKMFNVIVGGYLKGP